jgi:hypothetical protein
MEVPRDDIRSGTTSDTASDVRARGGPGQTSEPVLLALRSCRELDLRCTLEVACADRPTWLAALATAIAPLEGLLSEQPYIGGAGPNYCDYVVFSVFQWARLGSPHEALPAKCAVKSWRQRMIGLFDGLADRFPSYLEERAGTSYSQVWCMRCRKHGEIRRRFSAVPADCRAPELHL